MNATRSEGSKSIAAWRMDLRCSQLGAFIDINSVELWTQNIPHGLYFSV